MSEPFGEWFARERRKHGSQARVAIAIGGTEKTIREWERGKTLPDMKWMSGIAKALGLPDEEVAERIKLAWLELHRSRSGTNPRAAGGDDPLAPLGGDPLGESRAE